MEAQKSWWCGSSPDPKGLETSGASDLKESKKNKEWATRNRNKKARIFYISDSYLIKDRGQKILSMVTYQVGKREKARNRIYSDFTGSVLIPCIWGSQ